MWLVISAASTLDKPEMLSGLVSMVENWKSYRPTRVRLANGRQVARILASSVANCCALRKAG